MRAGQLLERLGIRDDVHAATHQQVSDHRPRRGIVRHLVNACFSCSRAALEEEVVEQIHLQIAGGGDVAAVPRIAEAVEGQRRLRGRGEMIAGRRSSPPGR